MLGPITIMPWVMRLLFSPKLKASTTRIAAKLETFSEEIIFHRQRILFRLQKMLLSSKHPKLRFRRCSSKGHSISSTSVLVLMHNKGENSTLVSRRALRLTITSCNIQIWGSRVLLCPAMETVKSTTSSVRVSRRPPAMRLTTILRINSTSPTPEATH